MRFGPFIAQGNILLEAKDHPINIIKSLLDYNYEMTICGLHNDLNDNTLADFPINYLQLRYSFVIFIIEF